MRDAKIAFWRTAGDEDRAKPETRRQKLEIRHTKDSCREV